MKPLAMVLAASLLVACAHPDAPSRHAVTPPPAWTNGVEIAASASMRADWWRLLGDPTLDQLVADAIVHNRDLAAARANIEAARALSGEARALSLPGGSLAYSGQRRRETAAADPFTQGAEGPFPTQRLDDVGAALSWELDFAGALRANESALRAETREAVWLQRQTEAAVAAEVARAYIDLQTAVTLHGGLETRIQSLEEIVARLGAAQALGAVPTDRVADARAVLEGSRAETPPLALAERNAVRRLATLTGRVPEWGLAAAESWSKDLLVPPQAIAIIDPQTALRHRPDVRAAEARLDAALARAGVARADLYPRVTLLGETGRTGAPGELQAASAIRFSYGLSLSWGVFDLESTRARIAAADAGADAALATWESVTLAALEEADGALDALTATRQVENAATRAAAAAQEAWLAAHARFVAGEASAVDLARAELVRLETAGRATTARADVARAWIGAHLALGAGWRDAG